MEQNRNEAAAQPWCALAGEPGPSRTAYTAQVRALNDALRQTFSGGRVMLTAGISALPRAEQAAILTAVQAFDRFDARNDPHGEHDFGMVTAGAVCAFWKIDAYDRALVDASSDQADPRVTARVLTIMLTEEY